MSTQCRTPTGSRPTTPQGTRLGIGSLHSLQSHPQHHSLHSDQDHQHFSSFQSNSHALSSPSKDFNNSIQSNSMNSNNDAAYQGNSNFSLPHRNHVLSASTHHIPVRSSGEFLSSEQSHGMQSSPAKKWATLGISQQAIPSAIVGDRSSAPPAPSTNTLQTSTSFSGSSAKDTKELPTPSSTPTTSRKSRRRSNLFIPSSKKAEEKLKLTGELGSGRAIPIKQGYLYKRSSNSLNKEWKKKYVTLCDDGRLTYHSSLHDYMDDSHGKEIALQCVTVKVPGQRPRGSKSILTNSALSASVNSYWKATNNAITDSLAGLTLPKERKATEKVLLTAFDALREPGKANSHTSGDEGVVLSNSNSQTFLAGENSNNSKHNDSQTSTSSTANVKKRHKRMKSSGMKNELEGK